MCYDHWRKVPEALKENLAKEFNSEKVTKEFLAALRAAIVNAKD